ncbi:LytTR family DNA-binding domain-containing protein [Crossiella sp. SN42]|uniref:LytR/AlgR family response regulator transcription factor n=1 Tax=Crossiella sp. SN42 TaxID=2944808 RepID=UPI00207C82A8|nr:LytTR family DNA-binding domain-containing protein [Crossiella sp. SN42]MCO1576669.1 LytTR family DNA-binding domain-containing protein [Crossiella sp. SN42]
MLRVLAVDDEAPLLEELLHMLRADARIEQADGAEGAMEALRRIDQVAKEGETLDAVFLDIHMPGLDGLELARLLTRFSTPPLVVFVTAYEDFAVEAFELKAVDYVLKPIRAARLAEAVRRVAERVRAERAEPVVVGPPAATGAAHPVAQEPPDEVIPVELGGLTRFVRLADVHYAQACGDYARLHTGQETHLIRASLGQLEERWRAAGFVRVHRSHLVSLRFVDELRLDTGQLSVRVGAQVLPVSRRHARELRDLLVRQARPDRQPPR